MKKPNIQVTINDGKFKGTVCQLLSYDRDRYYGVKLPDGTTDIYKGYWLDGLDKLGRRGRHFLDVEVNENLSHKEIYRLYKEYINTDIKPRVYFSMQIWDEFGEFEKEHFSKIKFSTVLQKIRYAKQKRLAFYVYVTVTGHLGFTGTPLVKSSAKEASMNFYEHRRRQDEIFYGTYERSIRKLLQSKNT